MWEPSRERIEQSNMTAFMHFLEEKRGLKFDQYNELYQWSINKPALFWESMWEYGDIIHSQKYANVLEGKDIRTAKWFEGAQLNFAENLLRFKNDKNAIVYWTEEQEREAITYNQLYKKVAAFSQALRESGVIKGDRVAAFITNRPEAIIGMLAAASIGAIWSSCSPDFGFEGVLDRFGQIHPKVLIAVNSYRYNGKIVNLNETLKKISDAIPEIEKIVVIQQVEEVKSESSTKVILWEEFMQNKDTQLTFEQLPFDHPLYIMYSSGTTGKPKCIVHGAGGTLLQHIKELKLHTDLKEEDTITYYTTCGWMMWNWLVSSLAIGATVFLYDGSPTYPNLGILFKAIEKEKINVFGTSPKFLSVCESRGLKPKEKFNLSSLKTILSTGSPLADKNFEYVYRDVKEDVQLSSISGGTDIISCFMLGNPNLPVYKGELQCRGLGINVKTYDEKGNEVVNEVGELVCTSPFPSRPIYFWNDQNGEKYLKAYFQLFTNVWRHGDFVKINERGGCIVYGRSDATLNSGGVRIGTAEIYGPVESLSEVQDSIVIGKKINSDTSMVLFVVLEPGLSLDDKLKSKIKHVLRTQRSPRHVPAEIYQVKEIPRTISGKKVELAVASVINGEEVTNKDALANPEVLKEFERLIVTS